MSTLLIQEHSFHTARVAKENREEYSIDNIEGVDFFDFCKQRLWPGRIEKINNRLIKVIDFSTQNSRRALVKLSSGLEGLTGEVIETASGKSVHQIMPGQTSTQDARMLIDCTTPGNKAWFFLERHSGNTPGLATFNLLKKDWVGLYPKATWTNDWVQFGNEFLKAAELKGIEVRRESPISFNSDKEVVGILSYAAKPRRGKVFPFKTLKGILDHSVQAQTILNIPVMEGDQQILEIKQGTVTKKYRVERGDLPKLQIDLGRGASDEKFVDTCLEQLKRLDTD